MTIRRFVVIGFLAFACALALYVALNPSATRFSTPWRYSLQAAKVPATSRSLRPNYPYSLVPGGVYSPEELIRANRRDPIIRAHYADFNLQSAQLVKTTEDQFQYVSYRIGSQIFWTAKRLRIPKGEILLTDGKHFCRTRCANRLSSKPHKKETTAMEPAERALNLPPFRPEMLVTKEVELAPPPPLEEVADAGPELPYDAPRLAPVFPEGSEEAILARPTWPAPNTNPSPPAVAAGAPAAYVPATQTSSGVPALEDAPEPATLQLCFVAVVAFTGFWLRHRRGRLLK